MKLGDFKEKVPKGLWSDVTIFNTFHDGVTSML